VKAEKALVKARLQAEKEWYERKSNFAYLLKKEALNLLRRIDPLKAVLVASTTFLVYETLGSLTEIKNKFPLALLPGIAPLPFNVGKMLADFLGPLGKVPLERMPSAIRAAAWGTRPPLTK